ncbi:MAG: hypothetical protein R2856_32280 [Caldilineaceae bacterium]
MGPSPARCSRSVLIVADEPVSMLDASLRMSIVNMFRKLKDEQNVTFLYVTHDLLHGVLFSRPYRRHVAQDRGNGSCGTGVGRPQTPVHHQPQGIHPPGRSRQSVDSKTSLVELETDEYMRAGCRYAGRCPAVMDICRQKRRPPWNTKDGR